MPLKTYKSKEEIPQDLQGEAVETKDGGFVVSVADETLSKVRGELSDAKKEVTRLTGELTTATGKAGELQRQLDAKGATGQDTDKKIADLLTKWEQDKNAAIEAATKPLNERLAQLDGELRVIRIDDQLKKEFIDAGGNAKRADDAVALNKADWDLVDGKLVRKENGQVTTTTAKEFFGGTFKKRMPEWYEGKQGDGGGAAGGGGAGARAGSVDFDAFSKMTPAEKMAFARQQEGAAA